MLGPNLKVYIPKSGNQKIVQHIRLVHVGNIFTTTDINLYKILCGLLIVFIMTMNWVGTDVYRNFY